MWYLIASFPDPCRISYFHHVEAIFLDLHYLDLQQYDKTETK